MVLPSLTRRMRYVLAAAALATIAAPMSAAMASPVRPATARGHSEPSMLTSITASHISGYDQLVFQFAGPVPAHRYARYVSRLPGATPNSSTSVVGSADLLLTFADADGEGSDGQPAYGPLSATFSLPDLIQIVTVADSRGTLRFGVGLATRQSFRVQTSSNPSRVIVDVRTPGQQATLRAYFVNGRAVFGTSAATPVERTVIGGATPFAALQRLFAGPTQPEEASGLRFVSSGATGFRLSIAGGIASVYLAGACASGGSTVNLATEIVPTLRQFTSVQAVKIYDPAGGTEHPDGLTNSVPNCLKPAAVKVFAADVKGPVLLVLLALVVLGLLIGIVVSVLSVVAGIRRKPDVITPAAYAGEWTKEHPVATGQFGPDVAWPVYPLRQMRADLARIEADRRARYGRLWHWEIQVVVAFLLLPITVAVIICLAVAGLTTLVLAGLLALVMWTCAVVTLAAFGVLVPVARLAERRWQKARRAEASCPRCYHVTDRPAYRCPGCSRLHRDIRPGRRGVLGRRCECGALLPTTVIRADRSLQPVCQRCEQLLRAGSAVLRDVRVPIFGETSAGKTRFMYAALDSLTETVRAAGIPLAFPGEESEEQARIALEVIRSGQDTVKTSMTLPTALSCRVGKGLFGSLVHLFDAAGESYRGAEQHDSLGFLDHGHGLVYVLDPFSIGTVRDQLAGQGATAIALAHAAAGDPETAYGEVVSRLRDSGVAAKVQRLAVVVSKADLVSQGGLELPVESADIAAWLREAGVHNLVLSAPREFGEVRYFAVASLAAGQVPAGRDPGAPLRWLLTAHGVRLPGAAGAEARARSTRSQRADDNLVGAEPGQTARTVP